MLITPHPPSKSENLVISPWSTEGKKNFNFFWGVVLETLDRVSDPISLAAFLVRREETSLKVASFSASAGIYSIETAGRAQSGTFAAALDFIAPCLCADEEGIFSSRRRLPRRQGERWRPLRSG